MVAKYTKKDLVKYFLLLEKKLGRTPKTMELEKYHYPNVNYYNRAFGNWQTFLRTIGRKAKPIPYKRKINKKRFFYPYEWLELKKVITNEHDNFYLDFLLHTGARYNEVANIRFCDIDFRNERITLLKTKGGATNQRVIQISTWFKNRLLIYAQNNKIIGQMTFNLPPIQTINRRIKRYCKKSKIEDYYDFSCHNIRKTTENWLVALNVNYMGIVAHMGHKVDIASAYYIGTNLMSNEDKGLIKQILDNLLSK